MSINLVGNWVYNFEDSYVREKKRIVFLILSFREREIYKLNKKFIGGYSTLKSRHTAILRQDLHYYLHI